MWDVVVFALVGIADTAVQLQAVQDRVDRGSGKEETIEMEEDATTCKGTVAS